ncbi:nucleotidyltransferase family protein [Candidatus Synechococcus calcipolaris G9]|uniref:Nucleotidyltransferase family protein n=1 Tax=Candidatus Synechococcus calcipolaris G9 TaxID=1497997 RepID=A0ABT6F0Y2_9SYNE|nr:nucleotidyltransferase family protein [Candidatus Synechococcus calcipolaris]MDG2991477.1 nucleotidyltransferase family protein [Candidatus Synechococcus calcipolaris G9]
MAIKTGLGIPDLLDEQRDEILKIAAKHGAYNVRVFGSVARGEADEESDIDFLVDYSLDRISPWFPAGLVLDLKKLLGRKVDVATEAALKERIREQVLTEAVPL